jgi:hypothetical protein
VTIGHLGVLVTVELRLLGEVEVYGDRPGP